MQVKFRHFLFVTSSFFLLVLLRSYPASAESNYTGNYDFLLLLTTIGSILVFLLVIILMFYFLYKFRANVSGKRKHSTKEGTFEAGWIGFAIILSVILLGASTGILLAIQSPPQDLTSDAIELKVEAYQWYWEIKDSNNTNFRWFISTTNGTKFSSPLHELKLKANQNYYLNITSASDSPSKPPVIHSFFSYELNFKIDAIPGKFNIWYFKITNPGNYLVTCAEYCGLLHYNMKFTIVAE